MLHDFKIVSGCLTVFALLIFLIVVVYPWYSNINHANRIFGDQLEIEHVIGSKRFHGWLNSFGCTYAIVKFRDGQANLPDFNDPDKRPAIREIFKTDWKIDWRQTSANNNSIDQCGLETLKYCVSQVLAEKYVSLITDSLKRPGSWCEFETHRSFVRFYIPNEKIIGYIRYGD